MRHALDPSTLAIWMDFTCIEQDDPVLTVAGVESLLLYAMRSHFIVIPVYPELKAATAFFDAVHPMDLLDYGERGWCRLETYVFLCIGEITGQAVSCYGYGVHRRCVARKTFNEELMATGREPVTGCCGCFDATRERLQPLSRYAAAQFTPELTKLKTKSKTLTSDL